jgi:drug/metabolite transporter (DMT)-like permease
MIAAPYPNRALHGALCGLSAAALFGMSAPLSKLLLSEVPPILLAGVYYVASGLLLTVYRLVRPVTSEAALRREDLPALAGLALLGGMLGPVLMLWGLARVSPLTGSLLLNLEAPFTMLVAVVFFGEHLGRHAAAAAVCIVLGACVLRVAPSSLAGDVWGLLAIASACAAWAFDNNLTQRLSLRDPIAVVRVKALAAGSANLVLGLLAGESLPSARYLTLASAVGMLSYGASIVLDAYALRYVGAAREAAYFSTAPFIGALASLLLPGTSLHVPELAALLLMAVGVVLLLKERHAHQHAHSPVRHEHRHTHDEHHEHSHGPDDPAGEPHSHVHDHAPLVHEHPHVPDAHHRHKH